MARRGSDLCMELLARSAEALSDESLAEECGLRVESVRRLRRDDGFIEGTNRVARRLFVAGLPRVLRALTEAACAGGNASAMKLFVDVCLAFERGDGPGEDDGVDDLAGVDVAELVERARAAGVLDGDAGSLAD